jgi:uncharacterized membrane protein YfcA
LNHSIRLLCTICQTTTLYIQKNELHPCTMLFSTPFGTLFPAFGGGGVMSGVIALGMLVGLVMALTGAGGGVLAVPLLVFTTGLAVQEVAPVGLLAVALAAILGAVLGLRTGDVRYKAALLMGLVGLICSPLGFWTARQVDTQLLGVSFAVVLVWVALNAFRSSKFPAVSEIDAPPEGSKSKCPCIRNPVTGRFIWTWPCATALVASGAVAGFLSGLLGVGGGFVLVPALQRFTNLSVQSVAVTSLAVISMVSTAGVLNSTKAGEFNAEIGIAFAAAAAVGMLAGRLISSKIPQVVLKKSFGVLCLVVAVLMLVRNFGVF